MAMASMFACTRQVLTAAFSAANVIVVGAVGTIWVSTHDTTRMLLMFGLTGMVPVLGHAACALSALTSAKPAAPAAVIFRKFRRCFCMNSSLFHE
jgi:uncharacterized membrane protein